MRKPTILLFIFSVVAPPPSPPVMKWLAVLSEKTSLTLSHLTPRSDWLYQPEDPMLIRLDMTRNSFIYHSLKCIHKVTDKYDVCIVYLTIALQVSLTT